MSIATAAPPLTRDRFGRPMIVPPEGGKPVAYTRATTLADTLDDRYNLEKWKIRQAAIGLADRPDLQLAVAAHRADKRELDKICDKAIEAAKSSAGATTGTALHTLTELVDRGQELPVLPETAQRDLEAYRQVTSQLQVLAIERFVVCDDIQVGGTADRIVTCPDGVNRIADLKTGSTIDFSGGSIAMQLAIYSRGLVYDHTTDPPTRTALPDVDQERAIVIHVPSGTGKASLHWVDIALGWEAVQIALRVRSYRKYSKKGLITPIGAGA